MSLPQSKSQSNTGRAESAFREAFERLKCGSPERLPLGVPVSQNNVAKEAGCDPSALRKTRYPGLIREIQQWIQEHESTAPPSPRQSILAKRKQNRSLKETIVELKNQRDHAISLLLEADAKILDLTGEIARLQARTESSNVTPIWNSRNKKGNGQSVS